MLGGGALAGTAAYFVFKVKHRKQTSELQKLVNENDRVKAELKRKFDDELKQAAAQITDLNGAMGELQSALSLKESEIQLLETTQASMAQLETPSDLWHCLLSATRSVLGSDLQIGLALSHQTPFQVISHVDSLGSGHSKVIEPLERLIPELELQALNGPQAFGAEQIAEINQVAPDISALVVAPIGLRNNLIGYLVLCLRGDNYRQKMPVLRRLLETIAPTIYRAVQLEDEIRFSRQDHLTGLANVKALSEILPPLLQGASEKQVSCLLIECDSLKTINDKYGHLVGDELIKQMAEVIHTSARFEELNSEKRPVDHLIRYCGTQFVLVMEDTELGFALTVAERIRFAVDNKTDWYGGVPRWSVSIGVVNAPDEDGEYQLFLLKGEVALLYVKEKLGGNQVIAFNQVPRQYRVSKLSARVGGSLGIFDPFAVLQSMATAGKIGILTVDERSGRKFWAFFGSGLIEKAHLGVIKGDRAVTEFLSTFEDGQFNFQEYSSLDKETMEEIHRMGEAYSVTKSITKHLIDGVAAQDKLASARRLITNTRLYVRPSREAATIIGGFAHLPDPPSRDEVEIMSAITKYVNGRTMLQTIMEKLEAYPTYLRWHGSAYLIQTGAVELSKLALTFSLEKTPGFSSF